MFKRLLVLVFPFFLFGGLLQAQHIKIGVLAKRGDMITLQRWQPTARYLEQNIQGYSFEIVPLSFKQIDLAVRKNEINFLITNSAFYVQLEYKYGISRIATLLNKFQEDTFVSHFGGVIFTKSDRPIDTINDLKNKSFAAVDSESFGGWIMAHKLFHNKRIDPFKYFSSLNFLGTHDSVVYAVLEGKVDAGTVRSDTLEKMAAEGKINLNDFYIINKVTGSGFPFLVSTQLYPEWPIAKLPQTKEHIAKEVALSLMSMPADSHAAISAAVGGWTIPANYSKVNQTLQTLQIGVYKYNFKQFMGKLLEKYFEFIVFAFAALIAILFLLYYVWRLNQNLKLSKNELLLTNESLETTVDKRTQSIETLLNKEKYLRVIMSTVSDINRYLITYKNLEQLLQKSCERLMKPTQYTMSFISVKGECCKQRWFSSSKQNLQKLERYIQEEFEQNRGIALNFEEKKSYEVINDVRTYDLSEEFRVLCLDAGVSACAFFALKPDVESSVHNGVVGILSHALKGFELEEIKMLEELSGDLGFAIEASINAKEHERLKNEQIQNYEETIISFVKMIEQRDTYTAGHTARVAKYSEMIAKQMDLKKDKIHKLTKAAILHDIGKISTPDAVLLKPGKLNDLEYQMIKEHVSVGYEMLKGISIYKELAQIMLHHHERYDGGGYPNGLKGEEIPLLSAIMSVADAFDAMTSTRIYKKSKSIQEAVNEIEDLKGKQFHPKVVDAAVIALKDVQISLGIHQNPTNEIERERLAYFYKDVLTGFYNESYLKLILNQKEVVQNIGYVYKVKISNALKMELNEGVKEVESYIKTLAASLQNYCQMKFYVKPASFYIFCDKDMQSALKQIVTKNEKNNFTVEFEALNEQDLYMEIFE